MSLGFEQIQEAAAFIRKQFNISDASTQIIGTIAGSGLGGFGDELAKSPGSKTLNYIDIPHFPVATVAGHSPRLVFGSIDGLPVLAMQGRFHHYEGHPSDAVVFPMRVLKALGCETVIMTNASGAINSNFKPGSLMLISDHINLTGGTPLIGPNDSRLGPRFFDMASVYKKELRELAHQAATELSFRLEEGVYAGVLGPCYETPAEIRMMRTLGADAVGMSTVWEVIAASHVGIKILAVACITNSAAGITSSPLTHEEVTDVAQQASSQLTQLLRRLISKLA